MDPECYKAGETVEEKHADFIMYNKHIVLFLNAYIGSYIHILVNTICI